MHPVIKIEPTDCKLQYKTSSSLFPDIPTVHYFLEHLNGNLIALDQILVSSRCENPAIWAETKAKDVAHYILHIALIAVQCCRTIAKDICAGAASLEMQR